MCSQALASDELGKSEIKSGFSKVMGCFGYMRDALTLAWMTAVEVEEGESTDTPGARGIDMGQDGGFFAFLAKKLFLQELWLVMSYRHRLVGGST